MTDFLTSAWGLAVVAAIVVAIVGWIVGRVFMFIPKRRRDFSSRWQAKFKTSDRSDNTEEITLYSFGSIVWGKSTCTWMQGGKSQTRNYKIFGLHRDRVLAASYRTYDQISSDRGVFVIQLNKDGTECEGMITGFEGPHYNKVESNQYHWERI